MENRYAIPIASAVFRYLMEEKTNCEFDGESGIFAFEAGEGKPGKKLRCEVYIYEDSYNVYVRLPFFLFGRNGSRMAELRDFLHRINLGLRDGNFEMGIRCDDIRYKCYVDCSGGEPSRERIARSIALPVDMVRQYWEGAAQILFHGMNAEDAVRYCETNQGKTPWEAYRWRQDSEEFEGEADFEPAHRAARRRRPAPAQEDAAETEFPGAPEEEEPLMERLRRLSREFDEAEEDFIGTE